MQAPHTPHRDRSENGGAPQPRATLWRKDARPPPCSWVPTTRHSFSSQVWRRALASLHRCGHSVVQATAPTGTAFELVFTSLGLCLVHTVNLSKPRCDPTARFPHTLRRLLACSRRNRISSAASGVSRGRPDRPPSVCPSCHWDSLVSGTDFTVSRCGLLRVPFPAHALSSPSYTPD